MENMIKYRTHSKIESAIKTKQGDINPFTQTPKKNPIVEMLKDDTPTAKPWANKWTMPFTETLWLKNSFEANKDKPNQTTGVFYYDWDLQSMFIRRENCLGDRFANGIRFFDDKPCIHQVTKEGKKLSNFHFLTFFRQQILLLA
jgi:hypothetical protein